MTTGGKVFIGKLVFLLCTCMHIEECQELEAMHCSC